MAAMATGAARGQGHKRKSGTAARRKSGAAKAPDVTVPKGRVAVVRGNDEYLVARSVSQVLARARDEAAGEPPEVADLDGVSVTAGALAEALGPTLFGGDRLVVVREVRRASEDGARALLDAVEGIPDGTRLLVSDVEPGGVKSASSATQSGSTARGSALARTVTAVLVKAGANEIVSNGPRTVRDRIGFVREEVSSAGSAIDGEAAALLVDVVGSDTRELASAAAQLVADMSDPGERRALRSSDVERFHRGRAEVTGFAIADHALAGDVTGALEGLNRAAMLGVHPLQVADALASGVRSLGRVMGVVGDRTPGRQDADRIGRELKIPGWKVRRIAEDTRHWSAEGILSASQTVSELNAGLKGAGTVADERYALQHAVTEVARARRGR